MPPPFGGGFEMSVTKREWTNPDGSKATIWVGDNASIGDNAIIGDNASIGDEASIGDGARIGAWARIGDRARIGDEGSIGEGDVCERPVFIAPLPGGPSNYPITITNHRMSIGCENHALADWWAFDDLRITDMGGEPALEYWRQYKALIETIVSGIKWGG